MTVTFNTSVRTKASKAAVGLPDMDNVVAVIMGGGQGSRLAPLTNARCKPAVHFGGRYKLIDIAMSNALNSGCNKIFVLTQFLSTSLHKHICKTYQASNFSHGFIELLSAEQKPSTKAWFEGTADAVRKNLEYLSETTADYFLILSGDQLYNIQFQKMLKFALETDADLVVAALPVNESDAKRMGILKINEDSSIMEFQEKPQEKSILDHMKLPRCMLEKLMPASNVLDKRCYLGSMGIYLFKRQALFNLVQQDCREDFGKHLIPTKVQQGKVSAFIHEGYWEDIGTISSFFQANLALTVTDPPLKCYDDINPIYAQQLHLPPPKIIDSQLKHVIICEGSIVEADEVTSSIIGSRSLIKRGSIIRNSYIMGNDYYVSPKDTQNRGELSIGEHCLINRAIIDRNVRIGNGVQLVNKFQYTKYDSDCAYIRNGIIIVPNGACLPDGFIL